jgi:acyl-CoA dehydrogenase
MNYIRSALEIESLEPGLSLAQRSERASAVAAQFADEVDRKARFPHEALATLKAERLMGIQVPTALGGEGAGIHEVSDVCYALGRACASTAMIYAMHQTKVACIAGHGMGSPWHERALRKLLADQLLFASSTTEGQGGGNVRSSAAPILSEGGSISLVRDATVISYGAEADGIVTTARKSEDAAHSDQVLLVLLKSDYELAPTGGWDTLGMRGTCSSGFRLTARGSADQVLPVPYDRIHSRTMTPVAHLLWSSVWAGIAAAAAAKAETFVRRAMRGSGGQLPPGAAHLAKAKSSLRVLRNLVTSAVARFEKAQTDEREAASLDYQSAMALTKVEASELAVETVMSCYRTCGLSGYRNDGEVSISRHLRDVLSSPIMINNERILASMSNTLVMTGVPASLAD